MVADLLNGNLVVDANTSCEILVSLLREARHIDARIAIITGLLSTLEESTSTPALRNHILDVFEESVLPMASQLNERRPTTEEEWKATEMPEVSEESSILTLLIHRIRSKSLQQEDRSRLVQIIMRALEQSARNNQRWMRLFVDKHGFELGSVDKLFVGPAHHAALRNILPLEFESLPDALFDALQAMILQNVDPSPGILHITDSIKADATLRGSIAGKHWLAQMDNSGRDAFHFGVESILELIQRGATSPQSQVRIGKLRQFITAVAERWMRQGEADLVYELAGKLTLSSRTQEGASMEWRANAIKALESIIHAAEALRKEGSSVSVMPNTFRLRLNILRLTYWTGDELATESQVTAVAEMVSNLVDRLVNRRRPYHSDFQLLKSEIYQIALSVSDHARAAIALARLHQEDLEDAEPPLAAYLRFELIVEGLKKSDPSKKEVKDDVKKMLEKWTTCSAEDLRVMGQQLDKELRKRKGWDTVEVDVAMIDA